ncbi:MAG: hypothetical protein JZU65_20145 [Chlorobium sp.]|nr:hypothetical protein [Chlorobium sp.]
MKQEKLFKTEMIPGKDGSGKLFEEQLVPNSNPIVCLGIEFKNDEERRKHFTDELREKLQEAAFRKIEGFPIGTDEDILNLSDPPYYTACPNPWITDFIKEWEAQKPAQPEDFRYHREPFAADVSEGKNDPIYNAHSYHTKVPHKAIMRYILHYTEPGDIVFDGFCGTGMTGVAAQMCGDKNVVMELGYQVKPDGTILQEETDEEGKVTWVAFSKLGARRAVLNDLSPAATFIAYNYNTPVNLSAFEIETKCILESVEGECGWMYETNHTDGSLGKIIYTIWSDVFVCPDCGGEVVFWDSAIDTLKAEVKDIFPCSHCKANLSKDTANRALETKFDSVLGTTVNQAKQVPVLIIYSVSGLKGRFEKKPDKLDVEKIKAIEQIDIHDWHPSGQLPDGYNTRQPIRSHGLSHVHHFYTKRNLTVLAKLFSKASSSRFKYLFTGFVGGSTKLNQFHLKNYVFGGGGFNPGPRKGTLYAPSISMEVPIVSLCKDRLQTQARAYKGYSNQNKENLVLTTGSSNYVGVNTEDCLLDYVFIDPPFGANLNYSELSFNWESWLNVFTDNKLEAIENTVQNKGAMEYRHLMTSCFNEVYRLLKPGRWMTVEFSNTKASVWNSIQTSLSEAGFIVANVSALDKKQGGINANISKTAVKQDLVISAYKPNSGFEERFLKEAETEEGVWDFIRTHLKYLPVTKRQGTVLQIITERDPRILFDQMVSYYVRKGFPVPIDSPEFQEGLRQRYPERDGMFFLPEQVAEYDRKKLQSGDIQQASLFVSDEASAIQWLRQLVKEKPQTFSDINPQFMQQLGGWSKNEAQLDLRELLNQNFLSYDGKGPVPEQIHAYLSTNWKELRNLAKDDAALVVKARDRWYVPDPNKSGDLEKLREKALLKEFEEYKQVKKKLKVFRLEAVRAGFKLLWQQRTDEAYKTIIEVAEKIPNNVLEEDPKLLMWYDQAVTRMGVV